ncbi:MAG: PorV/PorQ family protein [FCB group bacterium]|nr:PorV/PorQ family protein [FCB group bacterium]
MKQFSFKYIILLVSSLMITGAFAGDYAGLSGSFLRMGTSARSIAMGSAFTAEQDYGFVAYHNPAGVALLDKRQFSFTYQGLSLDRKFNAANVALRLPPTGGIGLAWIGTGVANIDGRSASGEKTGSLETGEDAFLFSFAQRIQSWLAVGINVKILYQQLPINSDKLAGKGTGVDLGIILYPDSPWKVALMIQDLNSSYQWNTGKIFDRGRVYKESFPTLYRLGSTFTYQDFYFTGDLGYITDHKNTLGVSVRAGVEYQFRDAYFLRAGFGNGRISGGGGMTYSLLHPDDSHLDYAFVIEIPAGFAHVVTYSIEF